MNKQIIFPRVSKLFAKCKRSSSFRIYVIILLEFYNKVSAKMAAVSALCFNWRFSKGVLGKISVVTAAGHKRVEIDFHSFFWPQERELKQVNTHVSMCTLLTTFLHGTFSRDETDRKTKNQSNCDYFKRIKGGKFKFRVTWRCNCRNVLISDCFSWAHFVRKATGNQFFPVSVPVSHARSRACSHSNRKQISGNLALNSLHYINKFTSF